MGWDNMWLVVVASACWYRDNLQRRQRTLGCGSAADTLHFLTAMTGCIILAFVAVGLPEVGGISRTERAKLRPANSSNFLPTRWQNQLAVADISRDAED